MTRNDARMIAEELAFVLRNQLKEVVKQVAKDNAEEYITAEEVADIMNISKSCLYHTHRANIPCRKVGKRLMFKKSSVIEYINNI